MMYGEDHFNLTILNNIASQSFLLDFVCEFGFGGEEKGRKGLWRCKPLFGSFKKIGKGFGGF